MEVKDYRLCLEYSPITLEMLMVDRMGTLKLFPEEDLISVLTSVV